MKFRNFQLERFFARYEFEVEYALCKSDCESMSIADLLELEEGSEEGLANLRLEYTETTGHPELRRQIAGLYDSIEADEVIVFSGAEEAIFAYVLTRIERGDAVGTFFPAYQSLFSLAEDVGAAVTRHELREENQWMPDMDSLTAYLKQKPHTLFINFPHNPTGAWLEEKDLRELASLAEETGTTIFSDEVYRLGEYGGRQPLPAMCDLNRNSLSLGVLSKPFGLPGLRIGWVASHNRDLLETLVSLKDFTTICASGPSEYLAMVALRNAETILQRNRQIVADNLARFSTFVKQFSNIFSFVPPKAGPVCLPRLSVPEGAEAFCSKLAEEAGVLLIPGTAFMFDDQHVRVGLGKREFAPGLERLGRYLSEQGYA